MQLEKNSKPFSSGSRLRWFLHVVCFHCPRHGARASQPFQSEEHCSFLVGTIISNASCHEHSSTSRTSAGPVTTRGIHILRNVRCWDGVTEPKNPWEKSGKSSVAGSKTTEVGYGFSGLSGPSSFQFAYFSVFSPTFPSFSTKCPPIWTSFTPLLSQASHEFPRDQGLQGIARRTAVVTKGARQIAEMGYEEEELPSLLENLENSWEFCEFWMIFFCFFRDVWRFFWLKWYFWFGFHMFLVLNNVSSTNNNK